MVERSNMVKSDLSEARSEVIDVQRSHARARTCRVYLEELCLERRRVARVIIRGYSYFSRSRMKRGLVSSSLREFWSFASSFPMFYSGFDESRFKKI